MAVAAASVEFAADVAAKSGLGVSVCVGVFEGSCVGVGVSLGRGVAEGTRVAVAVGDGIAVGGACRVITRQASDASSSMPAILESVGGPFLPKLPGPPL